MSTTANTYMAWSGIWFGFSEVVKNATPDSLVWRDELAYNEPFVEYYFRHPAYNNYPVVGVSWVQANDYCAWRSDRANEMIMVRKGSWKLIRARLMRIISIPFLFDWTV
jgi:formylglycine-generating enzyme required for sulfatase activity